MQLVKPAIKFILDDVYTKEYKFTTQTKISMLRGKQNNSNKRKNLILK